jgi:hypothetical protein
VHIAMANVKIAIIDNGVNEEVLSKSLEHRMYINEKCECCEDIEIDKYHSFPHGTICALIIEKYLFNGKLISIRILDRKGNGVIDRLEPALEWCYQNKVRLINLSLGTTHFREREELKRLVNKYTNRGLTIVAATSNSGFLTYPASFSNVIGVATTGSPLNYCDDYMQFGIDAIVSSEYMVNICGTEMRTSLSNSYATPYICALVANKIDEDCVCDVPLLKRYVGTKSHRDIKMDVYDPDWVYKAYVLGEGKRSKADYFFKVVEGKFETVLKEIDTIIVFSLADLEKVEVINKSLIYLGQEEISNIHIEGLKWCPKTRLQQMQNNHYCGNGLELPLIILSVETSIDEYYILSEFRRFFYDQGYNAYVIGTEPESVLYGLEYIPDFALEQTLIRNFIEGQTYYKQSDLVIWSVTKEQRQRMSELYPDYDVNITFEIKNENVLTTIMFDGKKIEENICDILDEEGIKRVYSVIKNCITEDSNE